jgi:hypothetical protein
MGARGIKRNGGEARLLRYEMELQQCVFCPPRDFLEHSGDPVARLSISRAATACVMRGSHSRSSGM